MKFISREYLLSYLKNLLFIGMGSQGECFLDKKTNKVFKIFHQYVDELDDDWKFNYTKENLLKFSNIRNNSYIFPSDVITVGDEIVGYSCDYVNGNSLFTINPLEVNLDKFSNAISNTINDVHIISDNGVRSYDVMYNILYGKDGLKIIDCDDYSFSDIDSEYLYKINCDNLSYEIMYFLVDKYFDEFINSYPLLKEMYTNSGIDVLEFIKLFKKTLSEYVGFSVNYLKDVSSCLNKEKSGARYLRSISR